MGPPYITPPLLLMHCLQQLLKGNKAPLVRNQAELIRSMAQHINKKATQAVCSYLMLSFAQNQASIGCPF